MVVYVMINLLTLKSYVWYNRSKLIVIDLE